MTQLQQATHTPTAQTAREVAADKFGSLAQARAARAKHLKATKAALTAYSAAHKAAIANGTARPRWADYEVTQ